MLKSLNPDLAQHFVGPDWVQTVCKGHQQGFVAPSWETVKLSFLILWLNSIMLHLMGKMKIH